MLLTSSVLNEFKNIPNSRHAKCKLQRAIAEHNSKLDSLKTGEEKVYKAPAAKCRGEAKTS